jgi:hypothetical protein
MPDVSPAPESTGTGGKPELIIKQAPVTSSVPANVVIGAAVAGVPNAGLGMVLNNLDPLAGVANSGVALFLNFIVAPLVKNFKWFPEHVLLNPVMFLAAFAVLYFVVFNQEVSKAFVTASTSVGTAIANYKADKAAGTYMMEPVQPGKEFG